MVLLHFGLALAIFEKWNLIERFILSRENGITLSELVPFIDNPPPIMEDQSSALPSHAVSECLHILAHFNGVPVSSTNFLFPEIVAERENNEFDSKRKSTEIIISEMRWESILYENQSGFSSCGRTLGAAPPPPKYLHEKYHVLTKLSRKEFGQCVFLNLFNFLGSLLLQNAIKEGSLLEIKNTTAFAFASGLLSLLGFYAKFFFCLPLARLVFVITMNRGIKKRNEKRQGIAKMMQG